VAPGCGKDNPKEDRFKMTESTRNGYLIDMDGVLYRGTELIAGADTFIQQLRTKHVPFRLLTNNSQRTRRDVVAKLDRLGIGVEEEQIFTRWKPTFSAACSSASTRSWS
jgi:ribonucleotide monophosphatase NagD (HAD superfamily)